MRLLNTKTITCLLLLSFLFVSCKKDRISEEEEDEKNNIGVALNPEIMRLGQFFGDVFGDAVLINVQSNATIQLQTPELKKLLELTERDDNFFIYNVHQIQTLNPEKFNKEISFEQAKTFNKESVDMLAKAIRYFKEQDKKVYVFGVSYGAFIAQELILQEGNNIADKFLLMTGRLDMPNKIWQSFSKGDTGGFINGTTPFIGMPSTLSDSEKNMNKLFGALSFKRYSRELSIYNDLKNVTYCFGTFDEEVGGLTQNEQAFLITRQVNLLELGTGHTSAIEGLIDEGFKLAFEEE